jgi:hypothetical protein
MQHSNIGKKSFAAFFTKEASKNGADPIIINSNKSILHYHLIVFHPVHTLVTATPIEKDGLTPGRMETPPFAVRVGLSSTTFSYQ